MSQRATRRTTAPRIAFFAAPAALACVLASSVAGAQMAPTEMRTGGSGSVVRRLDEDMTTARAIALGGRAEAAGSSTTALFANPAGASALRTYHVDALTLYDPTVGRFAVGSGIMDSTRNLISGGFSYVFSAIPDGPEARTSHDARLVVGVNLGQMVGLGARVRYLNISGAQAAPQSQGLERGAWGGFTFDAGLHVHPLREFSLSVTGYNLNNVNTAAAPITVGGGVAVSPIPQLTFVADALVDFRSTNAVRGRYSGGAELFLASRYAIRAGYLYDDTRGASQAFTLGAGYIDQNFGVELGYRQAVVPDMQSTLLLSVRYFYQAAAQQQQAQPTTTVSQ
ncbi:MAG: hypothetical protein JNK05_09015 [Myxococcales bacterium]|nr:hypothetical protein [Myxococcales bacterium]